MKHHKEDDQRIAIIGMGATLPGALDPHTYWQDQLAARHHITKLPAQIWDSDRLYDPTRQDPDRSYSNIGAIVRGFSFDPRDFGMPPKVRRSIDISQQATLVTARQALADAGIAGPTDGINGAVILGNLQGGAQGRGEGWIRNMHPVLEGTIEVLPTFQNLPSDLREQMLRELRQTWRDQSHEGRTTTSDCLPGLLGSITAARVAHFYNLRGPTQVIDSACASSLVALEQAVLGLRQRRYDLAVTGGVDFLMDLPSYAGFCALGALSQNGSFPFDRRADGFVMGEGAVMFVLKRLADAVRDDNFVYATILGVGTSSDGGGKALVAPNAAGQTRAMKRAWQDADVSLDHLGYFEAHGTATPLGDPTEITAIRGLMNGLPNGAVPMGSGKANVGHLKGAAGALGLLRGVFALHERTVPPQANFESANPHCKLDASPVRIPRVPEAWPASKRYAAVSAYGFGGINAHVVLGPAPDREPAIQRSRPKMEPPLGLGIIAFGANDRTALLDRARALRSRAMQPQVLARELASDPLLARWPVRVAFFAEEQRTAEAALDALIAWLNGTGSDKRLEAVGVAVSEGKSSDSGCVAFMFPGQGSQYVGMLDDLRKRFPVVQSTLDEADAVVSFDSRPLSSYMSGSSSVDHATAFSQLSHVEVIQPAILTCNEALRRLLEPLVSPRVLMGHSLGEYAACIAAGVMTFEEALRLVVIRGEMTSSIVLDDPGMMLGVSTDEHALAPYLEGIEGCLDIANKNCPSQTILAGATAAIKAVDERLRASGFETAVLPVSYAFHSRILAPVSEPLRERLSAMSLKPPTRPILSNVSADFYPTDETSLEWMREMMSQQIAGPVNFIGMIERAYADGIRVFVEVGAKRALHGFVADILRDKPHQALHVCHPKLGEVTALGRAVAALVANGIVAYGDPRRVPVGDHIEWRVPYVPLPTTPISRLEPTTTTPKIDSASQTKPAATPIPGFAALDEFSNDPRFWQYLAAQGPAIAAFLSAGFRAAANMAAYSASAQQTETSPAPPVTDPPSQERIETVVAPADVESAPKADVQQVLSSRAALTDWMLDRVAEITGYTRDELSLDADFEAELGVDSIRQIEIVIAVRDAAKLEPDNSFKMSDYPTLRRLIDYVATRLNLPADESSLSAQPDNSNEQSAVPFTATKLQPPYFAARVVLEPAAPRPAGDIAAPVLILHRGAPAAALHSLPFTAVRLEDDADEAAIEQIFREHQPATLIDLTSLAVNDAVALEAAMITLTRTFRVARAALAAKIDLRRVLVATAIDGRLGYTLCSDASDLARRCAYGAVIGAWKCVAREFESEYGKTVSLSVVDLNDINSEHSWRQFAAEVPMGGPLELALFGHERMQPVLRSSSESVTDSRLDNRSVVVAFGGARGITAHIARQLGELTRCRLILVGRSVRADSPPADRAEARQMAHRQLGTSATPTTVNTLASNLERSAEVENTLKALGNAGIAAQYMTADVSDGNQVKALLASVRQQHGRIDLIIHGAGVEQSKSLAAKQESDFRKVLSPKLAPLTAMLEAAPQARWVAFSSVAARFGNAGQLDYAAANEALAKATLGRDGLIFDFSAWSEVGMAATISRMMQERGVDPLPLRSTARFVAEQIAVGASRDMRGEWVIAGRLTNESPPPFGGDIRAIIPGTSLVQDVQLEFERLTYLRDHRVRTAGVLPAVVAMAAMESTAQQLQPDLPLRALRQVHLLEQAKVYPGRPLTITIRSNRMFATDQTLRVDCEVSSATPHQRAEVHLGRASSHSAQPLQKPNDLRRGPSGETLYETFFHGPSLRVIDETFIGERFVLAISKPLREPLGTDMPGSIRLRCLARELAMQAAVVHMLTQHAVIALPTGIDELTYVDSPREGEIIAAHAAFRHSSSDTWTFDVSLVGDDGRLLEQFHGLHMRNLGNFGQTTAPFVHEAEVES